MTYPTDYCPECGAPSPSYPCDICEEVLAHLLPQLAEPTDEELGEMAAYYGESLVDSDLADAAQRILDQGRIDAHDDMDHDYNYNV